MEPIVCIGLIPAQNPARLGQNLNVLVMAVNHSQDTQSTVIRVFGRVGEAWRELTAKPCTLRGGEHAHIYVTIPAQWLSPAGWEVEKLEELALAAGTAAPGPGVHEKLVFCQA